MCEHNKLIAIDDYTGIQGNFENKTNSQICGMFVYKKYKCEDCGRIITVLNAVVEEIKNV